MSETNKRVLITGASGGLGAAIAKLFASRGYELILVARRQPLLEKLKTELMTVGSPAVQYRVVDLADKTQVQNLADELPKLGVDVLINNAALGQSGYSWEISRETTQASIDLNVRAVAMLSLAFSKINRERPARLMNVASGAGYALFEQSILYSATKYFVTALTEGIAQEMKSQKLPMKAQLLAPGPMTTDFFSNGMDDSSSTLDIDLSKFKFHTAEQVAEFAMQLYESDSDVGIVQPDMTFALCDGKHRIGQLLNGDYDW